MKHTTTRLEIQRRGEKPRLLEFDEDGITFGFKPSCLVRLDPRNDAGPELLLVCDSRGASFIKPTSGPGRFSLNGQACDGDRTVEPGDVITVADWQIIIRNLPVLPTVVRQKSVSTDEPATRLESVPETRFRPSNEPHVPAGETQEADFVPVEEQETKPISLPLPMTSERETQPIGNDDTTPAPTLEPAVGGAGVEEERNASARGATSVVLAPTSVPRHAESYLNLFLGPVKEYLADDDVSEIMINGPRQVYVERRGQIEAVPAAFASETALEAAVMNIARSIGRFFNKDNPRLDARLPDGSRVHAVRGPLSRAGTVVAIRKFRREKLTLQDLIRCGSISEDGARLLDLIVKSRRNLLVSGATSSGKTSVLNVLSALIPAHERILVLEDASELQLQQKHTVCFETRTPDEHGKGAVTIRDLLHSALRLRPDRLVIGEIRASEALDLLQAMNTGHDGSMSTIHANSALDSLLRLEICALLSGIDIPLSALREQVASAIHIVVQTARLFDGSRKVTGISEVLALKDGEYQVQHILLYQQEGPTTDDEISGRHVFTGYKPEFLKMVRRPNSAVEELFSSFEAEARKG